MEILARSSGVLSWRDWSVRCALGRGGVSEDKREGDGATPVGVFPLRRVIYRADRLKTPATRLPIASMTRLDGWCDDPAHPHYNQMVRLPCEARHEVLWRDDRVYDVLVVVGHNDEPVEPGRGSAIFLHAATSDFAPTEGCVAIAIADLLALLGECGPAPSLRVSPD